MKTFILMSLQSLMNFVVAVFVYHFVLDRPGCTPPKRNKYLWGYGVIIPFLLCAPCYLLDEIGFRNVTLMFCLVGAISNLLVLRVMEAIHGTVPLFAQSSLKSFVLYYSGTLQVRIDPKTQRPVPFTRAIWAETTKRFLWGFVQTSLLFSILLSTDYTIAPRRPIRSFLDLYHWGNLVNNLAMALFTSLMLDGKRFSYSFYLHEMMTIMFL